MFCKVVLPYRKLINTTATLGVRNLSLSKVLMKNHYEVLEVNRDASQADIKNAYFRLSKMYHPDKIAATDENLKKFREISEAYEILGNEQSRKLYDSGLLGDFKRVGMDTDDLIDPVVGFYQKRQDLAKTVGKSADGIGIWNLKNFEEAKKKKQHDLFSAKAAVDSNRYMYEMQWGSVFIMFVSFYLFTLNFDNCNGKRLLNSVVSTVNDVLK